MFARGRAREAGCWAHTRRKFFDAQTSDPARSAARAGCSSATTTAAAGRRSSTAWRPVASSAGSIRPPAFVTSRPG
ncbi:MAG: transposase [Planctomycetes bacterium]|nr:transposase [Planctomycetota bacterium]